MTTTTGAGVTVLFGEHRAEVRDARAEGDDLWLPIPELEQVTGWTLKPEGACQGELCVPLPSARRGEFVRGDAFNVAALWRQIGRPFVHDAAGAAWAFGEDAAVRAQALDTLQAPDFTLPDLDGRMHSLADYRGKKVFLLTWSSW